MEQSGELPDGVLVHPHGLCESGSMGIAMRIWAFARALPGAVVGAGRNIGDSAYVEGSAVLGDRLKVKDQLMTFGGVTVEDDAFLGPGTICTNEMKRRTHIERAGDALRPTPVRRRAALAAGSVEVCGSTIGELTWDVATRAYLVGNPAQRTGWGCACGERLPEDLGSVDCGRRFSDNESRLVHRPDTDHRGRLVGRPYTNHSGATHPRGDPKAAASRPARPHRVSWATPVG